MALHVIHNKLQAADDSTATGIVGKNTEGFSLIELLVALVILSISLLALASIIITSIQVNRQNDCRNTAIRLTTETTENLLAQPIDLLSNSNSTVSVKIRGVALPYTVSTNIIPLTSDLKQINITVSYSLKGQQYTNNSVIYKHRSV
jgi:type IV pilus modification protein PilV